MICVTQIDVKPAISSNPVVQAYGVASEPNCTGYVLSATELNAYSLNNVFSLSIADGGIVAAAIAAVWCAAWAVRSIRSAL